MTSLMILRKTKNFDDRGQGCVRNRVVKQRDEGTRRKEEAKKRKNYEKRKRKKYKMTKKSTQPAIFSYRLQE